ncbi:MAG: ZIP family metal transporter [Planctomycetota bacterium]|nr:ZIP family metal transporter [Planctomycetota bacterium]
MRDSTFQSARLATLIVMAVMACEAIAYGQQPQTNANAATTPSAQADAAANPRLEHAVKLDNSAWSRDLVMLTVCYCVLIIGGSIGGGWLTSLVTLTHARMELITSLVGGLMLGIGMFHLLPHAVLELGAGAVDRVVWWAMIGLVTMFVLLRMFHFHQHGAAEEPSAHSHGHMHDHDDDCDHDHSPLEHQDARATAHHLSWVGVFFGLSVHTLIDGLALAASIQADASHGVYGGLFGIGTFAAILLHKPLDAVSITSLMKVGGWSATWRTAVNCGFAMMCPLGAALFFFGLRHYSGSQSAIVGCALAFSAGVFLCISLGDLLPEIQFHSHNRIPLTIALLLGIGLAYGIRLLEPGHAHQHEQQQQSVAPSD